MTNRPDTMVRKATLTPDQKPDRPEQYPKQRAAAMKTFWDVSSLQCRCGVAKVAKGMRASAYLRPLGCFKQTHRG